MLSRDCINKSDNLLRNSWNILLFHFLPQRNLIALEEFLSLVCAQSDDKIILFIDLIILTFEVIQTNERKYTKRNSVSKIKFRKI